MAELGAASAPPFFDRRPDPTDTCRVAAVLVARRQVKERDHAHDEAINDGKLRRRVVRG
jgi:hypothetical protein